MLFQSPVSRDFPFCLSLVEDEFAMESIKYQIHSNKLFAKRIY